MSQCFNGSQCKLEESNARTYSAFGNDEERVSSGALSDDVLPILVARLHKSNHKPQDIQLDRIAITSYLGNPVIANRTGALQLPCSFCLAAHTPARRCEANRPNFYFSRTRTHGHNYFCEFATFRDYKLSQH